MYRLSRDIRKYSTTPLVRVDVDPNGKEKETQVLFSPLKKKEGEAMLLQIAEFLNSNLNLKS
jgi:hypothetical protein